MQINGTKDTLGFLRWMVKTNGLRSLWPLGGGIMNSATLTIGNAIYYSAHEAIQRQRNSERNAFVSHFCFSSKFQNDEMGS
jgi:hypothetical protein